MPNKDARLYLKKQKVLQQLKAGDFLFFHYIVGVPETLKALVIKAFLNIARSYITFYTMLSF